MVVDNQMRSRTGSRSTNPGQTVVIPFMRISQFFHLFFFLHFHCILAFFSFCLFTLYFAVLFNFFITILFSHSISVFSIPHVKIISRYWLTGVHNSMLFPPDAGDALW